MAYNDQELRTMMQAFYMMQDNRIRTNNRISSLMYITRAIERGDVDEYGNPIFHKEERDEEAHAEMILKFLDFYEEQKAKFKEEGKKYTRINIIKMLETTNGPINNIALWSLVADLHHYMQRERWYMTLVQKEVEKHPVYQEFLSKIPYCGTLMSAVLLSTFDIRKARHMSAFWKYAGLDCVINPETGESIARTMRKATMEDVEYIDKNGELKTRKSIGYNPTLQGKLLGVLGPMFIKYNTCYRKFYDDARNRYMRRAQVTGERITKMQISKRAIRHMMQVFVQDLWIAWRKVEGYPYEPGYFEVYLAGRPHGEGYLPDEGNMSGNFPGRPYDEVGDKDSKAMNARRMLDMRVYGEEEAMLFTGIDASEILGPNYDFTGIDDTYNRPGEHKKRPKPKS